LQQRQDVGVGQGLAAVAARRDVLVLQGCGDEAHGGEPRLVAGAQGFFLGGRKGLAQHDKSPLFELLSLTAADAHPKCPLKSDEVGHA